MDDLNKECGRYGLKTNFEETVAMVLTKRREELPVNISLIRGTLRQVSSFKYLGRLVCDNGKCDSDIRARI